MRAGDIAEIVSGALVGADVAVDGAGIDTRELLGGELFVPVSAARDGHEFIPDALERGAAAYLTAHPPVGGTAIRVTDPVAALTALATHLRHRLHQATVVGITGSVGKTTTKDLAAAVLGRQLRVHASLRSFNNELGVPLTVLNAPDDVDAVIVEMGARGHGHIADLCAIARPQVGVVTTVELVHTEMFGDLEAVARAKGELIAALPDDGVAVLNITNPFVADMAGRTSARVMGIGVGRGDVRAEAVEVTSDLRASFRLCSPWGDADVVLGVRGEHNVMNALAAAALGLVRDVPLDEVVLGLQEAEGSPWRMELRQAPSGALVLNDAYNAGPASVEAALRALARLDARRRVAVLGPMAELGTHHTEAHRAIGDHARRLGIEVIAVAAPDYGAFDVADVDAAFDHLGTVGEGDAVLVKGSRVAGLERLAHRLLEP